MKSSKTRSEKSGCDNGSCRSGGSLFFWKKKCYLLGKLDHLKKFLLFLIVFVEKQLRFFQCPIFEINFFVPHQHGKFIQYQTHASNWFLSRHENFGSPSLFQHIKKFRLNFFMFVLYRKWCEDPLGICVNVMFCHKIISKFFSLSVAFCFVLQVMRSYASPVFKNEQGRSKFVC